MFLSDGEIFELVEQGELVFEPFHSECVGPWTVDLHLDNYFYEISNRRDLTVIRPGGYERETVVQESYVLHPGEVVEAFTHEVVTVPPYLGCEVTARSSWARIGLQIASAVDVHPGWTGAIALELTMEGALPGLLKTGDAVCQIKFARLGRPALNPYGSKGTEQYQYQNPRKGDRV